MTCFQIAINRAKTSPCSFGAIEPWYASCMASSAFLLGSVVKILAMKSEQAVTRSPFWRNATSQTQPTQEQFLSHLPTALYLFRSLSLDSLWHEQTKGDAEAVP